MAQTRKNLLIQSMAFLGVIFVAWLDATTHRKLSFYLFYFPSLILTAWYGKKSTAYTMVVVCSTAWFFSNINIKYFAPDFFYFGIQSYESLHLRLYQSSYFS